jgi:hypothetical protein
MRGEDERTRRAHEEAPGDVDAARSELVELGEQCGRRHDDAVSEQTLHTRAQDARRDEVQHGFRAVDDERVSRVVTALEAHHRGDPVSEQVDYLALSLVAPLGADHDDIPGHRCHCRTK